MAGLHVGHRDFAQLRQRVAGHRASPVPGGGAPRLPALALLPEGGLFGFGEGQRLRCFRFARIATVAGDAAIVEGGTAGFGQGGRGETGESVVDAHAMYHQTLHPATGTGAAHH